MPHPCCQGTVNAGVDNTDARVASIGDSRNSRKGLRTPGRLDLSCLDENRKPDPSNKGMLGKQLEYTLVTIEVPIKTRRSENAFFLTTNNPPVLDSRGFGGVGQQHFDCGRAARTRQQCGEQAASALSEY